MSTIRLSAYQLGLSSRMIRFCMQYLWAYDRFILQEDPVTGLRDQMDFLSRAPHDLHGYLPAEVHDRMSAGVGELQPVVAKLINASKTGRSVDRVAFGYGICPGEPEWLMLVRVVDETFEDKPLLKRWRNLGAALGDCWLQMIRSTDDLSGAPVANLFEAAAQLVADSDLEQQIPILARCATAALTCKPTAADLCDVAERSRITAADDVYALDKLEQAILDGIARLPRHELRLKEIKSGQSYQAVLDGEAFAITADQFKVLTSLKAANGERRRSKDIIRDQWGDNFPKQRIDRFISKLPEPLLTLIESRAGHGGGVRLCLE